MRPRRSNRSGASRRVPPYRPAAGAAAALAALLLAVPAAPAAGADGVRAAASAPVVRQLVAFRDGSVRERSVRASSTRLRVRGRLCRVGAGTALAVLVRSGIGPLGLRDYARCSSRAADAGGLFVYKIAADRNAGSRGWVYKVGTKLATAGAGDPDGAFGRGRLRRRAEITWFYCTPTGAGHCQRTLYVRPRSAGGGVVTVRALAYSDRGRAIAAAGALVRLARTSAVAGPDGLVRFTGVAAGRHRVTATRAREVRALTRTVTVP